MPASRRVHHQSATASTVSTDLERVLAGLTTVLVAVAVGALTFTATNVTQFAIRHGVSEWIAWMLDPLVGVALGTVLVVDGLLSEHDVRPGGWASALRWFGGLATWLMNCWDSLWPDGTPWGIPRYLDPAGLVLHSIPPVLLIVLAEAITAYRRQIIARLRELEWLEEDAPLAVVDTPAPAPVHPPVTPVQPVAVQPEPPRPAPAPRRLQVICGAGNVYRPVVPAAPRPEPVPEPEEPRELSPEEALEVISQCWHEGLSIRKAADQAGRAPSYVGKVYQRLAKEAEEARAAEQVPGQMEMADVA